MVLPRVSRVYGEYVVFRPFRNLALLKRAKGKRAAQSLPRQRCASCQTWARLGVFGEDETWNCEVCRDGWNVKQQHWYTSELHMRTRGVRDTCRQKKRLLALGPKQLALPQLLVQVLGWACFAVACGRARKACGRARRTCGAVAICEVSAEFRLCGNWHSILGHRDAGMCKAPSWKTLDPRFASETR